MFIGLAEEHQLIDKLGTWVLWEACRLGKQWQPRSRPPLPIAVNIASLQFEGTQFLGQIQRALASSGLTPRALRLEVTERTMMTNAESSRHRVTQLRELGVQVLMDDFGIGYSNLMQLMHLPVEMIKLDRAFLTNLHKDSRVRKLLKGIINLAHGLHLRVISEGIETEFERDTMVALKSDFLQGYLLAKPMSVSETTAYVQAHQRRNNKG